MTVGTHDSYKTNLVEKVKIIRQNSRKRYYLHSKTSIQKQIATETAELHNFVKDWPKSSNM